MSYAEVWINIVRERNSKIEICGDWLAVDDEKWLLDWLQDKNREKIPSELSCDNSLTIKLVIISEGRERGNL